MSDRTVIVEHLSLENRNVGIVCAVLPGHVYTRELRQAVALIDPKLTLRNTSIWWGEEARIGQSLALDFSGGAW